MDAREKLMQILDKPVFPEGKPALEAVTDYLLENDVVPVTHAHWAKKRNRNDTLYFYCSGCGLPVSYFWERSNYCPNCGAKMDGDTDE